MNECGACGEDFGSPSAFSAHLVGTHVYTFSAEHPDGRRCLTPRELLQRNWTRDGRGRWRRPNNGAPWAVSRDQVTTERRSKVPEKAAPHVRRERRSTRLPASQRSHNGR
jgi:hypothetical protein